MALVLQQNSPIYVQIIGQHGCHSYDHQKVIHSMQQTKNNIAIQKEETNLNLYKGGRRKDSDP